jgi:UDP:flavonoid glycosyltransferase YjiC (YdhE family)
VHCGGVGATLRSLNAGVPQMVIPRVNDQFDNARRVERLGAGIVVEHPITTQQMGDGLRRLISGEFKIERVAQRDVDTQDSVVLGCDYLESFFYRHTIDA